ncbi:trafficking protein particle complex subunit 10 [Lentinula aciculospora]|uniref:Trafficking protein particle complex subunit 10 n=1 Tax=Lentinula aciculospora TaxID=153920 RepID=A0A9W9DWA6_9AGAR|nr:trafficking protein particle complex subunit 10 [Lentinula aciculospora]
MAGPKKSVIVSYSSTKSFLSSSSWTQILQTLNSHLPLRNIHWKSASRPSIRTIHELDVTLVNLDTIRDEHTSQIPTTLLERPLLNIYVITCENNDLEAYRATVKKQIKEWHATVSARKNQEWLILHVVRADTRVQSGAFFTLKGSVLDKVRADFNTEKRERCVQLVWSGGTNNPAAWAEFLNKLRDGVLSAFESAVIQREEEVRRSEGQRQMPGWNFCTFFILKESLATSFEGMTLYDDALVVYEELEISFYQVLKEKNLSWFGTLISPSPTDDSAPLLSISKKEYRELILANNISVFDFRIYVLSRQCELLAKGGRLTEVCTKVGVFLSAFGRRLREIESEIPPFFIESWIYSSALSAVDQCDTWGSKVDLDAKRPAFNSGKAELLELARNQLDMLGIDKQFLPCKPPFSSALIVSKPENSQPKSIESISNPRLTTALKDQDTFYDLYILTTNRAIDLYAKSGRRKFALKLHGSLAALDLHRGRLDAALTTYNSLPAHYAPHSWTSLESAMLSKALDTHETAGKPKDREWIHVLLAFFKTYVESGGSELLLPDKSKVAYISQLMKTLETAVSDLDSDLFHPDHPALRVQTSSVAFLDENRDGSYLQVTVHNYLPCPVSIGEISVFLLGRDSERFQFTSASESLASGTTKLKLFCPIPCYGSFLLDSSEIRMKRLILQWSHRRTGHNKSPRSAAKDNNVLVRIPQDLLAFDVRLRQPPLVALGAPPSLLVVISTGRNEVSTASFNLSAPSVTFEYEGVTLSTKGITPPDSTPDCISLRDLPGDKEIELLIPHSDVSSFHSIKVTINVDYITASEPSITRSLRLTRVINTTLPVSVNVEDFFRGDRLFSKFIVSTLSHQHVRISNARLEPPDAESSGLSILACSSSKRGIITITPAQPAQFLFQINSDGPVREALSLNITYRMLREEVEFVVQEAVDRAIVESPSWKLHRIPLVSKLIQMLETDASWVEIYGISGELHIPKSPSSDGALREPVEVVKKMLQVHRHPDVPLGPWHDIKIPVDVPIMNIVAAACLSISVLRDTALYAGQPIPVTLTVHSSFHWGTSANDKERQYVMQYDVEEMVKEWLVSGKKRGTFVATDDGTFTVPLTLVALHHGEFTLPKVIINALPLTDVVTMGSMAIPNTETYQVHGAEKVLISPRGGRSTFVLGMGST